MCLIVRDETEQLNAVGVLKAAIIRLLEEVSVAQGLDKVLHDLNRRIYELLVDRKSETQLGAVLAIEALVELLPTNNVQLPNQSRYAAYLRSLLPTHDAQVAAATSRTLAKLALSDPLFSAEIIDFELPRSIDWIKSNRSYKEVMCGLSLLSALVCSLPSLSTAYFSSIVQYVWPVLNDPKEDVFSLGVSVLIAILKTVNARKRVAELVDYAKKTVSQIDGLLEIGMFSHAGFIIKSLILNELCDDLLLSLLPSFATKLMCHSEDADLIPLILKCGQGLEWFEAFLSDWMHYLLNSGSLSTEFSLSALSATLRVIKANQRYYDSINAYLIQAYTPSSVYYECVSSAANALKEKLDCKQLAPLTIRRNICLTQPFKHAIAAMCMCGSRVQSLYIERVLIDCLCGSIMTESERINLLSILACINFDPRNELLFGSLGEALIRWFSDDTDTSIRSLAGTIYLNLIAQSAFQGIYVPKCSSALQLIVGKLAQEDSKLVCAKLYGWFECNTNLDQLLARSPLAISTFATAVNHSHLGTRLSVYAVLKRLSFLNPSSVLPRFYRLLIQCLADLRSHITKRLCTDGAATLTQLLAFPSGFLLPYTSTILSVVVELLPVSRFPLAMHLVMAIGKIAEIDDAALLSHFPDIIKIITTCMQDATSTEFRLVSLQSLCSIVRFIDRESLSRSMFTQLWHQTSEALRTEQEPSVRNEVIKVLGCIGAIDPYKIQAANFERALVDTQKDTFRAAQSPRSNADEKPSGLSATSSDDVSFIVTSCGGLSSPECVSMVAMHHLLKILGDPALSSLHITAVETIVELLQCTGPRPVKYIKQVFQSLLAMLKQTLKLHGLFEFYTLQISKILLIVRNYARAFVPDLLQFLLSFPWVTSSCPATILIPISSLDSIFTFIRSVVVSLKAEAHSLVFDTLPTFLHAVEVLSTRPRTELNADDVLLTAVQVLFLLGPMLIEYSHVVVKIVCSIIQDFAVSCGPVSRQARDLLCFTIKSLPSLNLDLDFSPAMPTLVPLIISIAEHFADFHQLCHDAIRSLAFSRSQRDFSVVKSLVDACANTASFEEAFTSQPAGDVVVARAPEEWGASHDVQNGGSLSNLTGLRSSWNNSSCNSKDEWFEWIKLFGLSLVKDSPNTTVRVLGKLASLHYPMARDLFNLAFAVVFDSVKENEQEELVAAIENAFAASSTPLEVIQQLLNLAEFLEHEERPVPIDIHTLGAYAYKCHAFAKALYYKELEYKAHASTSIVESLISINHQMQQPDAAAGLLTHAQKAHGLALKESWYEKLNRWDEALKAYEKKLEEESGSYESLLGVFRCRNALGHWRKLTEIAKEIWPTLGDSTKVAVAPLATASAWAILDWESMNDFVVAVSPAVPDGAFFRAVLAARNGDSELAFKLIDRTRELLDTELTALISESYARAYKTVVRVQGVSELEEAIFYLSAPYDSPHRRRIERTWNSRLLQCQESVEVWQRILKLHLLAISPRTSFDLTTNFAKLCQKSGRTILARECYCFLLNLKEEEIDEMDMSVHSPTIAYCLIKHLWNCTEEDRAIILLQRLIGYLSKAPDSSNCLARCHHRMGLWLKHRALEMNTSILDHFQAASSFDRKWYRAWHGLAMASQEMIASFELHRGTEARPRSNPYVVPSIQSFFKSIGLAKSGGTLQDTLRLLTLWFKFGNLPEVSAAISDGFYSIPVENWLNVIPQLIARIHVPNPQVRRLIHHVLADIGRQHPQALVMQITVASKSPSMSRRTAALALLDKFRSHSSMLVDQVDSVSFTLGSHRQPGAHPRCDFMGRNVARRIRGGFKAVLWRPRCRSNAVHFRSSPSNDQSGIAILLS